MGIEWDHAPGWNGRAGELLVAAGYGWRVAAKVDAFPTIEAAREQCVLCLVEHRIWRRRNGT